MPYLEPVLYFYFFFDLFFLEPLFKTSDGGGLSHLSLCVLKSKSIPCHSCSFFIGKSFSLFALSWYDLNEVSHTLQAE